MTRSQDLTFLYRQAPRWDSYIVQSYFGTVHHFRHPVTVQHPELDVFIAHATVPYLGTNVDEAVKGAFGEFDPVSREHVVIMATDDAFSRGWWMKQVDAALVASVGAHGDDDVADDGAPDHQREVPLSFESPERLLGEFLDRYFDLEHPYRRPDLLDHIEEVEDDMEPPTGSDDSGVINLDPGKRRGATGEVD